MLAGYLYFYNPVWLVAALVRNGTAVGQKPAYMQIIGMIGLVFTIARTSGWAARLMFGQNRAADAAARQQDSDARTCRHDGKPRHHGGDHSGPAPAGRAFCGATGADGQMTAVRHAGFR